MAQIFRIALLTALCLVNCRSASVMQHGVFAPKAMLPLLLSLVPAAFSTEEEDAGEDADLAVNVNEESNEERDMASEVLDVMQGLDTDQDGLISMAEMMPEQIEEEDWQHKEMMTKAWNVADGDKNGKLSVDELAVAMKEWESMVKGDSNGNHLA